MSQLPYLTENNLLHTEPETRSRTRRKASKIALRRWIVWSFAIALWAGILYASFSLAQSYVSSLQHQLSEIATSAGELEATLGAIQNELNEHRENLAQLKEQFAVVQKELAAVKEELALAGDTIHSSDETRQALSQRITDLGTQLEHLRNSIAKLEEAARVF